MWNDLKEDAPDQGENLEGYNLSLLKSCSFVLSFYTEVYFGKLELHYFDVSNIIVVYMTAKSVMKIIFLVISFMYYILIC